jgi:hypothetical protein
MNRTQYILRPKSSARAVDPLRLLGFDLTVEHDGKKLGGNNIQAVVGAPDRERRGLDEDVALRLSSGWWITLRNQFDLAPCVAMEILNSVAEDLSSITAKANQARGADAEALNRNLSHTAFSGEGPDYWR